MGMALLHQEPIRMTQFTLDAAVLLLEMWSF